MKKVMTVALLMLMLIAEHAFARVIFYDDAENAPNTSSDWSNVGDGGANSLSVSGERVRAGSRSYKFSLAPYGTPGTQNRVELVLRGFTASPQVRNFLTGQEYWMGWSIYIPHDFVFPNESKNEWATMSQFHGATESCDNQYMGPCEAFFLNSSVVGFRTVIRATAERCSSGSLSRAKAYTAQFKKGAWNDVVLNFRYNYTNSGSPFFKMWLNGQLVANDTGANCYNDAMGPYFKMGIYGNSSSRITVYYDEIRVGDETSSYNEVAPKGSAAAAPAESSSPAPPTLKVISTN